MVSVLFPRDGSQYRRKTKPAAGTAVGRLSKGNVLSPRLPERTPAGLPSCHPSNPSDVTHSWYKLNATGLNSQQLHCFTPTGDPGQGFYRCMCRSADAAPFGLEYQACCPNLLLLLHQAEQQHRSTGAGETCTVRSFFIIPPCQSGTL